VAVLTELVIRKNAILQALIGTIYTKVGEPEL